MFVDGGGLAGGTCPARGEATDIPRLIIHVRHPLVFFRARAVGACRRVHAAVRDPKAVVLKKDVVLLIDADADVERRRPICRLIAPEVAASADAVCALAGTRRLRRARRRHAARIAFEAVRFAGGHNAPRRVVVVTRQVHFELLVSVAAAFEAQRLEFVITHGQRHRAKGDVAVQIARHIRRTVDTHESALAVIGVHAERVLPSANRRDCEWDAHVEPDILAAARRADGLVGELRGRCKRTMAVAHRFGDDCGTLCKRSHGPGVGHRARVAVRRIERALGRVEIDTPEHNFLSVLKVLIM